MGGSQKESLHNRERTQNQIRSLQAPYVGCQGTLNPKPLNHKKKIKEKTLNPKPLNPLRVAVFSGLGCTQVPVRTICSLDRQSLGAPGYFSSWGGQQATAISGFMLLGADHSQGRMNSGNCSHSQLSAGRVTYLSPKFTVYDSLDSLGGTPNRDPCNRMWGLPRSVKVVSGLYKGLCMDTE